MGCNDGEAKASPSKGCVVRPISCVGELDEEKLPDLLTLKYQTVHDAVQELGDVTTIRQAFVGFQRYLYQESA